MRKNILSEKIISTIKEETTDKEEIIAVYIFGSFLHSKEYKDIDIGILLKESFEPDYLYEIKLQENLEKAIRSRLHISELLDIHILNHQDLRFLFSLLGNSDLIHTKDNMKRAQFEARVLTSYLDIKPFYENYDKMRKLRYENR